MESNILTPRPLLPGDCIAILSPSGAAIEANVLKAAQLIREMGYEVKIMPHVFDRESTLAGTDDDRCDDLTRAFSDPHIRAILCSRGGYGAVRLLPQLSRLSLRDDPKWLIGFSDITALHALMWSRGIVSVHSPMTRHIASNPSDDPDTSALFDILSGETVQYSLPSHPFNHQGQCHGRLAGGNLAVMEGLVATPFDMLRPDTILFIEDIAEPIYKVERILWQLKVSGILPRLRGLLVGRFTDYRPGLGYDTMEEMIRDMVAPYHYPIAFGVPVGHVDHNIPLPISSTTTLDISPQGVTLCCNQP